MAKASSADHEADMLTMATLCMGIGLALYNLKETYSAMKTVLNAVADVDPEDELREGIADYLPKGFKKLSKDIVEALAVGRWDDEAIWNQVKDMSVVQTVLVFAEGYSVATERVREFGIVASIQIAESKKYKKLCPQLYRVFWVMMLLYLLMVGRAAVQAYMSAFVCKQGLYNIGVGC